MMLGMCPWEIQINESNRIGAKAMKASVQRQLLAGPKERAQGQKRRVESRLGHSL